MEEILRRNPKVLVDDRLQGIVPFLPLGEGGVSTGPKPPTPQSAPAQPQLRPPPAPAFTPTRPTGIPR
jgi:membrane protease subunit HflK